MSEARKDFSNDRTFLIDMTKCTGCRGCQVACKQWNQLKAEKTTFFSGEGYQNPPAMSEHTFTRIKFRDYQKNGQNEFAFYKEMCMHCNDPACASVCPVGAFRKTPEGPVVYDAKRCIGCRFCMVACPFGVPKYEWSKAFPLVRKCTGCYSRVKEGLKPACATTCPSAITYGNRGEMIRGETKDGGPSGSIFQQDLRPGGGGRDKRPLPFGPAVRRTRLQQVTKRPIPSYTWQALRFVPGMFLTAAGSLTFISWFTHRKERIAKEEEERKKQDEGSTGGEK